MVLTTNFGVSMSPEFLGTAVDETADVTATDYSGYSFIEASYKAMVDQQMNWNMLTESIATMELGYLRENGVDIVYEWSDIKDTSGKKPSLLSKGISIIKSWLSKIFGIINNWITSVNAKVAGQLFAGIPKNGAKNPTWPEGKKYKDKNYMDAYDAVMKVDMASMTYDKLPSTIRSLTGKDNATSCSPSEIVKHLATETVIDDNYGYNECIEIMKSYKDDIAAAKKMQRDAKKVANDQIKQLKDSAKKKSENTDANEGGRQISDELKEISVLLAFNTSLATAKLSIMIGRLKLARHIVKLYNATERASEKAAEKAQRSSAKEDKKEKKNATPDEDDDEPEDNAPEGNTSGGKKKGGWKERFGKRFKHESADLSEALDFDLF